MIKALTDLKLTLTVLETTLRFWAQMNEAGLENGGLFQRKVEECCIGVGSFAYRYDIISAEDVALFKSCEFRADATQINALFQTTRRILDTLS